MPSKETSGTPSDEAQHANIERSMVEIGGQAVDGYTAEYGNIEVVGHDIDDAVTQLVKQLEGAA